MARPFALRAGDLTAIIKDRIGALFYAASGVTLVSAIFCSCFAADYKGFSLLLGDSWLPLALALVCAYLRLLGPGHVRAAVRRRDWQIALSLLLLTLLVVVVSAASEFSYFTAHIKGGIENASPNAIRSLGLSVLFAQFCGLTLHRIWFFQPRARAPEGVHPSGCRTRHADCADCRETSFDIEPVGRTALAASFQPPTRTSEGALPTGCRAQKSDCANHSYTAFTLECDGRSSPIADGACVFYSTFREITSRKPLAVAEDTRAQQSPVVWFPQRVQPTWEGMDRSQTPVLAAG
ncbi:hypothetical protein [Hyphomicrobium facile]|uniref:Uncharacterized protein n=1 Tax=Hyphomicrobium facile TaxID=51670 RepID=A0A1I7NDP1_9HYPH|nr:hypothetical protein [Hyphomicrobium facile]SFV32805.1 hypothetical protein SAMN04488557_1731 [Hyphomicrobium facile]